MMLAHHANGLEGHSGILTTLHKVRALFSRPNMKHGIKMYTHIVKFVNMQQLTIPTKGLGDF
jgi:hypothetical protein